MTRLPDRDLSPRWGRFLMIALALAGAVAMAIRFLTG